MSILSTFRLGDRHPSASSPETVPQRMTLEERQALRRDMLYECISQRLADAGVHPASRRFSVAQVDQRGHSYAVMIKLSNDYLLAAKGTHTALWNLGQAITISARADLGIAVTGVFWQVDPDAPFFHLDARGPASSAGRPAGTGASTATLAGAMRSGRPVHVDGRTYSTDMSPLARDQ